MADYSKMTDEELRVLAGGTPETGGGYSSMSDDELRRIASGGGASSALPKQNKGALGDIWTDVKRGAQQLPGAVTGLADIPAALAFNVRPASAATDWLGEQTGFTPGKWAQENAALYSPARQEARANVDKAWEEGGVGNIAASYFENPSHAIGLVAESLPATLAGGLAGRAAMGVGAKAVSAGAGGVGPALPGALSRKFGERAGAVGAALGEGAVGAGSFMDNMEEAGVEPRTAAAAAIPVGGLTAAFGYGGARMAKRMGVADVEQWLAGASTPDGPLSNAAIREQLQSGMIRKMFGQGVGGAVTEGIFEELPQGLTEQLFGNLAQERPWYEGLPRAGVESVVAGMGMGGAFNAMQAGGQDMSLRGTVGGALREQGFMPEGDRFTPKNLLAGMDRQQDAIEAPLAADDRNTRLQDMLAGFQPLDMPGALPRVESYPDLGGDQQIETARAPDWANIPGAQYNPVTGVFSAVGDDGQSLGRPPRVSAFIPADLLGDPLDTATLQQVGAPTAPQPEAPSLTPLLNRYSEAVSSGNTQLARALERVFPEAIQQMRAGAGTLKSELQPELPGMKPRMTLEQAQQAGIVQGAPNAVQEPSAAKVDARQQAGDGQALAEGNAQKQAAAKTGKANLGKKGKRLAESLAEAEAQKSAQPETITFGGTQHTLTPEQATAWHALTAQYKQKSANADRFSGDQQTAGKAKRGYGMQLHATRTAFIKGLKQNGTQTAQAQQSKPQEAPAAAVAAAAAAPADTVGSQDEPDLSAAAVSTAAKKRAAPTKAAMDAPQLAALRQLMRVPKQKGGEALQPLLDAAGTVLPKVAPLFKRIHALTVQRDKLNTLLSAARDYNYDPKTNTWRRGTIGKVPQTLYTTSKDKAAATLDEFYAARAEELRTTTNALGEAISQLEAEVGYNNLAKAQAADKGRGQQTKEAVLFSSFYRDFNDGTIGTDKPVGTSTPKEVRERRELGSMAFTKWASIAHSFKFGKASWSGVEAVLMKIRHHGQNPYNANIASRLYYILQDAKKDANFVEPKLQFYSRDPANKGTPDENTEYLQVVNPNTGSVSFDKKSVAPTTSPGQFQMTKDGPVIHITEAGQNNEVLLHEVLHYALAGYIEANPNKPAVNALDGLRKQVVAAMKKATLDNETAQVLRNLSGANGLHEFLSYGLTNRALQDFMKGMTLDKAYVRGEFFRDAWNAFAGLVRTILGIPKAQHSAFSDFLLGAGELLTEGHYETFSKKTKLKYTRFTVTDTRGDEQPVFSSPVREQAHTLIRKGDNDARGFLDSKGQVAYVFGSNDLIHDDVVKALGWKEANGAKQRSDPLYKDDAGNVLTPVYFETNKAGEMLYYQLKDYKKKPVSEGMFSGEVAPDAKQDLDFTGDNSLYMDITPEAVARVAKSPVTKYAAHAQQKPWLQGVFETMGYGPKQIEAVVGRMYGMKKTIRDFSPTLAGWLSLIDASFNIDQQVRTFIEKAKADRGTPIELANDFARYIEALPANEAIDAINYLDGTSDGKHIEAHVRSAANNLRAKYQSLLTQLGSNLAGDTTVGEDGLPTAAKHPIVKHLEGLKISEALVYVLQPGQTATTSFGAHSLNLLLGSQRSDAVIEDIQRPEALDIKSLDGRFYRYVINKTTGEFGFIHESLLGQIPLPSQPDTTLTYKAVPNSYRKDGPSFRVSFAAIEPVSRILQGYKDEQGRAVAGNPEKVAAALLNTISIMSNAVSAVNMAQSLAVYGGKHNVVFDSKAALAAVHGDKQLLLWGDSAWKSKAIIGAYRAPGTWVQVPNSEAYGALRGKIVHGPDWMAIQDAHNRSLVLDNATYNLFMRWFKKAKTVYNLPTHTTNVLTNTTLAYMHNISFKTWKDAMSLYIQYKVAPGNLSPAQLAIMSDFMNSGAVLGDFSTNEVKATLYSSLKEQLDVENSSGVTGLATQFMKFQNGKVSGIAQYAKKKGLKVDEIMTQTYASEDNAFRLAAFMMKMGDLEGSGKPQEAKIAEAGLFAKKAFLDYDIDSRAVQTVRQTVLPFFSWTYAIIPVLTKIAVEQPWKMVQLGAVYSLVSALASAAGGDDDDDETRARLGKTEKLFGAFGPYTQFRFPLLDKDGEKSFITIGKYVPNPFQFKEQPNGFMGMKNWPSAFQPSGPLMAFAAAGFGVDPYTGKKLAMEADTNMEAAGKSLQHLWQQMTPGGIVGAAVPGTKPFERTWEKPHGTIGNERDTFGKTIDLIFGAGVTPVNEAEAAYNQRMALKGVDKKFGEKGSKMKRDVRRGNMDVEDYAAEAESLEVRKRKEILKTLGREE